MKINRLILICSLLLSQGTVKAQLTEIGVNFGYVGSRYTIGENKISDQLFVSQGNLHSGVTAGMQVMIGAPKEQNVPYLKLKHGVMLEMNLCKCGGNIDAIITTGDRSRSFTSLRYTTYRGDYSVKYVAKLNKFRILAGPVISNYFYRGVTTSAIDGNRSAKAQLNDYFVSAELGIGVRVNQFTLSSRYQLALTEFGKETAIVPTQYNYHGVKFMVAYFFLEKHKGKYWDSIYW
jgi:hypothetical protein